MHSDLVLQSLLAAVQETASEMMADTQAITMEYTHKLEEADRQHKAVQTQVRRAQPSSCCSADDIESGWAEPH